MPPQHWRRLINNQIIETQEIPGRPAVVDALEAHAAERRARALTAEAQDAERRSVEEKLRSLGGGVDLDQEVVPTAGERLRGGDGRCSPDASAGRGARAVPAAHIDTGRVIEPQAPHRVRARPALHL